MVLPTNQTPNEIAPHAKSVGHQGQFAGAVSAPPMQSASASIPAVKTAGYSRTPDRPKVGVILAAGKGDRLNMVDTPKVIAKIGSKPLLLWNIEQMQEYGVEKIYVVVGFRGDEIKKEIIGHPLVTANVEFIDQSDTSASGPLLFLKSFFPNQESGFFLAMGDLVIGENPYFLFDENRLRTNMPVYSLFDGRKEIYLKSGANSKAQIENTVVTALGRNLEDFNSFEIGVYYVDPRSLSKDNSVLGSLPATARLEDLFKKLIAAKRLGAVMLQNGEWFDVNTPATFIRANIFARRHLKKPRNAKIASSLETLKSFSGFKRGKEMKSEIVVETGILSKIKDTMIIPLTGANSTHYIITDTIVDALYGEKVLKGFLDAGYDVHKLVVPSGESSKSISEFTRLADEIFSYGLDKHSFLISLGGGVINNIAGFLASSLYRGIGLIHIPTTSMAQVDASIDFKQAINSPKGKNLIGSYYPASLILMDPEVMLTLNDRHMVNGIAESIKHALIGDKPFVDYLKANANNLQDVGFLEELVKKTIELKVPLLNGAVEDDVNEMLPQYGHSIGHAVEHLSGYELLHGEAVAIGMCVSAEVAYILGICDQETVEEHYKICELYDLPTIIDETMEEEDIINVIHFDKHHVGNPHMALPQKVGVAFHEDGVHGIPIDYGIVRRAIRKNKERKTKAT